MRLLLVFLFVFRVCDGKKVDEAENEELQNSVCGKNVSGSGGTSSDDSVSPAPWTIWIDDDVTKKTFAGSLISSRHIVTSSALLFRNINSFVLKASGRKLNVVDSPVEIPLEDVPKMKVFACRRRADCDTKEWTSIEKATYIGAIEQSKSSFGLLVLEMTSNDEVKKEAVPVCLANRRIIGENGDEVQVVRLKNGQSNKVNVGKARATDCSFAEHPDVSVCFFGRICDTDVGTLFFKTVDGRATAVAVFHADVCGVTAAAPHVDISKLTSEICQVTGVCVTSASSEVFLLTSALLISFLMF